MNQAINSYLASLKNQSRANEARTLIPIMEQASGYNAYLSGTMIGFGSYHYQYETGHSGDAFVTGMAPRAQNTVVYVMPGFDTFTKQLSQIGKHKLGKSCLYLGALKNTNLDVLADIVQRSVEIMHSRYNCKASPE